MQNSGDNVIPIRRRNLSSARETITFRYPHEVLSDTSLDLSERRAILSAWASDVNAVESWPMLRHLPGTPFPVTFASIMDALSRLDRMAGLDDDDPPPRPQIMRQRSNRIPQRQAA